MWGGEGWLAAAERAAYVAPVGARYTLCGRWRNLCRNHYSGVGCVLGGRVCVLRHSQYDTIGASHSIGRRSTYSATRERPSSEL